MTMPLPSPIVWPCLLVAAIAAISDCARRRIPNWLVLAGLLIALPAQWYTRGVGIGTLQWLGGIVVGMALLMPGYLMRQMGAGDVKLMGAIGGFLGVLGAAQAVAATYVAGGLLALAVIAYRRIARRKATSADDASMQTGTEPSIGPDEASVACVPIGKTRAVTLPYATAIGTGAALVLLLHP